ncbi:MAG: serine/threonine-protein kinase [Planctomycetota bacterium]
MPSNAETIFRAAQRLDPDARDAFIDEMCGDDTQLRREVQMLLSGQPGNDEAETLAAAPAGDPQGSPTLSRVDRLANDATPFEAVDQQVGRYKLLEQIGEGGFGSVWAAEQREPVKRRVALKIIKLGMDTKQVIARFEAERQALAMMDHPNIAKVLDAGTTETGRPFFVMELVRGVPILEYCDTEKLDTTARLELFALVCNAIQHAHQKGIIHRDIKPSNVLVTLHDGVPVPKVIDFGIAKATNQELTEKTIYTQHRQMIGTPVYMSPEQAEMSGLDIDTRSDIYSLGVVLYELLTGTTPFTQEELATAGYAEMTRMLREVEPNKPSSRLSSLRGQASRTAEQRRIDPRKLRTLLQGDLDWIVMKCLEKDRTRRYETANGLAGDIRRHLDDEPVLAGPPSAAYKLSKFVKRNRGQVIGGGVVALAMILGVVGTSVGLVRAISEKERADAAASVAESARDESEQARLAAEQSRADAVEQASLAQAQLNRSEEFRRFMVELLSSIAPDSQHPERSLAIRELIDEALDRIKSGTVRDTEARSEVLGLLADTAYRHTWYDLQIDLRYELLQDAEQLYGRVDRRTVGIALQLCDTLLSETRGVEVARICEAYMPAALALDDARGDHELEMSIVTFQAAAEVGDRNYEPALVLLDRALELAEEREDPGHLFFNHALRSRSYWMLSRYEEAMASSDVAKEILDESDGSLELNQWVAAVWYANQAQLMMELEQYEEALELFLEAAARRGSADDFSQYNFRGGAAEALWKLGRQKEALEMASAAREGLINTRAPEGAVRDFSRRIIVMLSEMNQPDDLARELGDLLQPPGLPVYVYREGTAEKYHPSAFMGSMDRAVFDQSSTALPYEGEFCIEWRVSPGDQWVGIGWVEPANDWGDLPGGYDLTGATRVSFAARGELGGETVGVGIGVIDQGDYPDSLRVRQSITVSQEWERYSIPLDGADLSLVRGGFLIGSDGSDAPISVYFDDIRFE